MEETETVMRFYAVGNMYLSSIQQGIQAAMTPQQLYNQYASVIFGTPNASYNPNFQGTQGYNRTSSSMNIGLGGGSF